MSHKLIEKLYFGFLLLLPLVFSNSIIDSVLVPRQIALTAFVLVLAIICIAKKSELHFPYKTPVFLAAIGFLIFNLVSFGQANVISESHVLLSKLSIVFAFFFLTTILLYNNLIRVNQLILAVILFGLVTLSFSFFNIAEKTLEGQHILRQIETVKGNEANKNLLASILFLSLPFYFIGLKRNKIIRLLALVGIIASLFVLITIRTRIALIACLLFFAALICYKIKQRFALGNRIFLVVGVLLMGVFLFGSKLYVDKITPKSDTVIESNSQKYVSRLLDSKTLESRVLIWKKSLQMAKDDFWFGVGDGNWQIQFPKYGLSGFNSREIVNGEATLQRPHNDFLWILCETGILGFISYLAFFSIILYQLIVLLKKSPSYEKWPFFVLFNGILGYLLISFFDFPYERIEHQVIVMVLLAIATSSYLKNAPKQAPKIRFFPYLLLLPVGYSLLVSIYRYNGELHTRKMYLAKAEKNWDETIYEAKKADNYFYRIDNTTVPLSWYEGLAHFAQNRMEESENCFSEAYNLTPYNIQVITNLASVYQVNGKPDDAVKLYNTALQISPRFDEAKLNLAAFHFNKKEYDKAYSLIDEIPVTSKNPKYQQYLIPILNNKVNTFLKNSTDKNRVEYLVKNIKTKETLLRLFFDSKRQHLSFESHLKQVKF